ncbi:exported hypothetical protein [Acidobacteriia bacterium SbA2]|nr:exported hypothetical protein [Acidobacteriia bacterium SbA2]
MPSHSKTLLTVSLLLISFGLSAQQTDHYDSALLARLSYERSAVVHGEGVQHVCVAVARDGGYRIVRSMDDGQTTRLRGKMPKERLQQLTKLLASPEFRAVSGEHSGLIRQDAESFAAEIIPGSTRDHADGARQWLERDVWRLQWLNADGESPFPVPVAKVVDWLQQFQPVGGKTFSYAEFPDVCPSSGLRLLQPTVAGNQRP